MNAFEKQNFKRDIVSAAQGDAGARERLSKSGRKGAEVANINRKANQAVDDAYNIERLTQIQEGAVEHEIELTKDIPPEDM